MRTHKAAARCLALLAVIFVPGFALGAPARPHIEFRPVVECTGTPGEMRSTVPQSKDKCISPEVIVPDADVIGAKHDHKPYVDDVLDLIVDDHGRDRFYEFTLTHWNKQLAIIMDGAVVSTPLIMEAIDSNIIQVTGLSRVETDGIVDRMKAPRGGI